MQNPLRNVIIMLMLMGRSGESLRIRGSLHVSAASETVPLANAHIRTAEDMDRAP